MDVTWQTYRRTYHVVEVGDEDLVVDVRAEVAGAEVVHRVQVRDVHAPLLGRSRGLGGDDMTGRAGQRAGSRRGPHRHTPNQARPDQSKTPFPVPRSAEGLTWLGMGQAWPYS